MDKILLELIAIAYWHDTGDCGAFFDQNLCLGNNEGQCHNYEFCKKYNEAKIAIEQT